MDNENSVACAGAVIRDTRGRLLLVRRAHDPGRGLWSLPGGRVRPGESPADAMVREVWEETGLRVRPGPLLGTVRRGSYLIDDFAADLVDEADAARAVAGDDALDVRWCTREDLATLPLTPLLLESLADFGVVVPGP